MVSKYPLYTLFGMHNFIKTLVLSAFCLTGVYLPAQMTLDWQRTLGGSDIDITRSIIATADGGYMLVGETFSDDGDVNLNQGGRDAWLAKMDGQGNLVWQKTLGGSLDESFHAVVETADGGFALAGYTYSSDGDISGVPKGAADCWLVRVDSAGNILWERSMGGSGGESALALVANSDGGFTLAGYTYSSNGEVTVNQGNSDVWVIKVDFLGNIIWQKTFGGSEDEWGTDLIKTDDGGFAIAGWTGSDDGDVNSLNGVFDFWLIKLAANGTLQWENTFGGNKTDKANALIQSQDGTYFVVGYTSSTDGNVKGYHGSEDFWIVRVDVNGSLIWQQAHGGVGAERASDIVQVSNRVYAVVGHTFSTDGDVTQKVGGFYDYWLMELNPEGDINWEYAFGGSQAEYAHAMTLSPDNGYVIVGETLSNDKDVSGNHGFTDGWVVKTRSWATAVDPLLEEKIGLNIFPNPVDDRLAFTFRAPFSGDATVELLNIQGQSFFHRNLSSLTPQFYQFDISLVDIPTGVYLLRLNLAGHAVSRLIHRK